MNTKPIVLIQSVYRGYTARKYTKLLKKEFDFEILDMYRGVSNPPDFVRKLLEGAETVRN